jgi:hypothetical protein
MPEIIAPTIQPPQNALLGRDTYDWQAGANSPIVRKVILKGGNWKEKAIPNEIQFIGAGQQNAYDSLMCVYFNGVTDPLEYLLMEMLRQNKIPAETVNWLKDKGYFENGVINFNERFSALKGGISALGAYQWAGANGAKNCGLIPQKMLGWGNSFAENIDPKCITPEMTALGLEFLTHLAINYEWVNAEDTVEFMEYSPLACIGQYADGEGILNPPTSQGHCMLQVNETPEYREIDDSYWRQFKKYNRGKLQSFMAFYITPLKIPMNTAKWIKDNDLKWVQNSNNGQFYRVLRGKLMILDAKDGGSKALLDDKMRTEPAIKITQAEFEALKEAQLTANF